MPYHFNFLLFINQIPAFCNTTSKPFQCALNLQTLQDTNTFGHNVITMLGISPHIFLSLEMSTELVFTFSSQINDKCSVDLC